MNEAFVYLIAIPLLSAPIVYFSGRVRGPGAEGNGRGQAGPAMLSLRLAATALLLSWVPYLWALRQLSQFGVHSQTIGGLQLQFDGFSALVSGLVLFLASGVIIFASSTLPRRRGDEKHHTLLLIMSGGMIGLGCATDLFNLWLWFELMAISSYLLVAFYHQRDLSLEASVKYLVQNAAGSLFVLLGLALIFGQAGTLAIDELQRGSNFTPELVIAGGLIVVGFGVKAALVPLHTWIPDAYSQAPATVSALMAGAVTGVGLLAMVRTLTALPLGSLQWATILLIFACLNMVAGNFLAFRQRTLKRMLAFSSVSHIGYILLGFGLASLTGLAAGARGGLFHLFNHGLMKALAFFVVGAIGYGLSQVGQDESDVTMDDLHGVGWRYPLLGLALLVSMLGLVGMPPLAGFMSKWQILAAGVEAGTGLALALVIFAGVNSVFSLSYYAPVLIKSYFSSPTGSLERGKTLPWTIQLPIALVLIAVILIGLVPTAMNGLLDPATEVVQQTMDVAGALKGLGGTP